MDSRAEFLARMLGIVLGLVEAFLGSVRFVLGGISVCS